MRVLLHREITGPFGVFRVGETADLPAEVAAALRDKGFAELVEGMAPPAADTTDLTPPVAGGGFKRRKGAR